MELGEDPAREGLKNTPRRVEKAMQLQERLTIQIAETIRGKLEPRRVAVVCGR